MSIRNIELILEELLVAGGEELLVAGGEELVAEVVTVGEALLRLATPTGQRLATASTLDVHVAGAEANAAATLAQLGVRVRWVSRLPDTTLGRRVERELAGLGVLVDAIEWAPDGRLGLFFSDTGATPRPTTVTYDRRHSTFAELIAMPEQVLDGARMLHLTGITPALGVDRLLRDVLAQARRAQAEISVDVNYRAMLWSPAEARVGIAPLLRHATTVICGEQDARTVLELVGDPHDMLEHLREQWAPTARHVVITCGAAGCVALDERGTHHEQRAPETTVIDRFGMGDAFAGGLLWGLLRDDLELGLRAGVTLAALKATIAGDLVRTDISELLTALAPRTKAMVR